MVHQVQISVVLWPVSIHEQHIKLKCPQSRAAVKGIQALDMGSCNWVMMITIGCRFWIVVLLVSLHNPGLADQNIVSVDSGVDEMHCPGRASLSRLDVAQRTSWISYEMHRIAVCGGTRLHLPKL